MTSQAGYNILSSDGLTPKAGLGDEANICGAQYRYCQASGALAAYGLAHITAANLAIASTTNLVSNTVLRPTGFIIPQFVVATLEYFWGPVGPWNLSYDNITTFKVLAANAALGVRLYTTPTDGVVDDAITTGLVGGLALTETVTTQEAADCVATTRLHLFDTLITPA